MNSCSFSKFISGLLISFWLYKVNCILLSVEVTCWPLGTVYVTFPPRLPELLQQTERARDKLSYVWVLYFNQQVVLKNWICSPLYIEIIHYRWRVLLEPLSIVSISYWSQWALLKFFSVKLTYKPSKCKYVKVNILYTWIRKWLYKAVDLFW